MSVILDSTKFFGLVFVCAAIMAAVTVSFALNYLKHDEVRSCESVGQNHVVIIKNDHVEPQKLQVSLCHTMTLVNQDAKSRSISFGKHDKHVSYDGITSQVLGKDDSMRITFNQTGSYIYHDHFDEKVGGQFTVTER